jgi:hypothetical protein
MCKNVILLIKMNNCATKQVDAVKNEYMLV